MCRPCTPQKGTRNEASTDPTSTKALGSASILHIGFCMLRTPKLPHGTDELQTWQRNTQSRPLSRYRAAQACPRHSSGLPSLEMCTAVALKVAKSLIMVLQAPGSLKHCVYGHGQSLVVRYSHIAAQAWSTSCVISLEKEDAVSDSLLVCAGSASRTTSPCTGPPRTAFS